MSKRKKRRSAKPLIAVLVVVLIAVIALILWKQWEYGASRDFYDGLRGALGQGGVSA